MRTGAARWVLLIILTLGISGRTSGQQTSLTKVVSQASAWLNGQASPDRQPVVDSLQTLASTDRGNIFILPFSPDGYVLVSDQGGQPTVLGWSDSGHFPANPMHPLRNWLINNYILVTPHESRITSHESRIKSSMSTDDAVSPLVTARWGQGDTWNRFCPADSTGRRALVGCVGVAMAQIMKYWQWPGKGTGSVTYTPLSHPDYGELSANFDTTRYRWDLMEDLYPTDASGLLMYHAGVASYMNYGPIESATSVDVFALPALKTHFSYQVGMVFRDQEGYAFADWVRMLKQELINGRPILYTGTSPDGKVSHAFNLDGFRGDYFFHFNWGWDGAGDGWYTLPEMGGVSADFSAGQAAIFGMQPEVKPLHDRPSLLEVMPGDAFVQLFWQQPVAADFSHFTVYRDGMAVTNTSELSYRDEGLANQTACLYEVTASYTGQYPGESEPTPGIVTIPWEAITPGYVEGFESGTDGWQLMGDQTGFVIGEASELGFNGHPGRIAAIRSEGLPAGSRAADYLTSPVIYPASYSHLAISFDYLFRQNQENDHLFLMYRDFLTGVWQPITRLDSTGGWSDWTQFHIYLPRPASNAPIQVAFYYNDFYGDGYGAAVDNVRIYEVTEKCVPAFSADIQDLCEGQVVTFTDQSTGPVNNWFWDFGPGAEPRYANTPGPHEIAYSKPGAINVTLSLNHLDHLTEKDYLRIRNQPVADLSWSRSAMSISFTSKASYAEQLLWIFGDGATSTETNPVHVYWIKLLYEVSQIAYNGTCPPDTLTIELDLRPGTGIEEPVWPGSLSIWPNPTAGRINLIWNTAPADPVKIYVLSPDGKVLNHFENVLSRFFEIDLSDFPEGIYILRIISGRSVRTERVVKT